MMYLARWIFVAVLVSTPVFAQTAPSIPAKSTSAIVRADLTRRFSTEMGAIAGRQTTFGDFYAVSADCLPLSWVEVIIMTMPLHGQADVISREEPISYPDTNPRKSCNGKPITAKALSYTPDSGYAGEDMMVVQKISSNGYFETVTYRITVLHAPRQTDRYGGHRDGEMKAPPGVMTLPDCPASRKEKDMTRLQTKMIGLVVAGFAFVHANATSAQMPQFGPECTKLKALLQYNKSLQARINAIRIGNKRAWCPLRQRQIANEQEMLSIYDSDFERCGLRDDVVSGLRTIIETAGRNVSQACGN